jgi:peptidoglycan/LPS O-acetylase OafA/YrhL
MIEFIRRLPQKLTRITSGGKLISEIDGLRFAAILPVVLTHLAERMDKYKVADFRSTAVEDFIAFTLSRGFVGVNIFFLISGFVLALPFAAHRFEDAKKVSLKSYFVRRLTRLEPPYILIMTGLFLVLIFIRGESFSDLFPHYAASIVYIHNIVYQLPTPINPVAWTLEIEVQFYILAPLLAFVFFYHPAVFKRRLILVLSTAVIMTTQQVTGFSKVPGAMTILGQVHYFLAGILLADIFLVTWKSVSPKDKSYWYDVLAFLSLLGIIYMKSPALQNRAFFLVCLFCFFLSAFKGKLANRFFTYPWITAIGGMCYTIYLIHLPFLEFFALATRKYMITDSFTLNYLVRAAVALPVLLAVSIVLFLLIEKPCMDKYWPSKLMAWVKSRGK